MISNYKKAIWNGLEKDKITSQFLENVFDSMKVEIENCINKFSFQEEGVHNIFWRSTEMSWLGMWNNSIIRCYNTSVHTLRELSIYTELNRSTRPDLLVVLEVSEKPIHYLFEGKLYELKSRGKLVDNKFKFDSIEDQVLGYRKNIENVLVNYNPIIIPLVFEWMRDKAAVQAAKEYFESYNEDTQTQFCALYATKDTGMWLYGKVLQS